MFAAKFDIRQGSIKLASAVESQIVRLRFQQFIAQCKTAPLPTDEVLTQRYAQREAYSLLVMEKINAHADAGEPPPPALVHKHKGMSSVLRSMTHIRHKPNVQNRDAKMRAKSLSPQVSLLTNQLSSDSQWMRKAGDERVADSRQWCIRMGEAALYHPWTQSLMTLTVRMCEVPHFG